jgi:hypothetical protein
LKKLILILIMGILPAIAFAADPLLDEPHWSAEIKGGKFSPALENWAQYYGTRTIPEYAASLSYKLRRQVELGVGGGTATAKGKAFAPIHNFASGDVTFQQYPLNLFLMLRGIINEGQWLVPYAGGGFTRMYYREQVEGQATARGIADGYHYRGGLQLLLDNVDRGGSNSMYLDYGVFHTYFFVEMEKTKAIVKAASVDLGGTSYNAGLLFEF